MSFVSQIYYTYEEIYNEGTNQFWEETSINIGTSILILKEIFGPKANEYEMLEKYVNKYLEDKTELAKLFKTFEENDTEIIDYNIIREMFLHILEQMNIDDIEEIVNDDEQYYFSIILCEAVFMAINDILKNMCLNILN